MKLQSEISREFLKTIFARLQPLASAARCGLHTLATPLALGWGPSSLIREGAIWTEEKFGSQINTSTVR